MKKLHNVPILLIGDTGEGKSSFFGELVDENGKVYSKGLPGNKTMIINTEAKPLPFSNQQDFTNKIITSYKALDNLISLLQKSGDGTLEGDLASYNHKFDYIVLDSFTSMCEHIHKYTSFQYAGYEVWGQYNIIVMELVGRLKKLKQQVFVTAIPEQKEMAFNQIKLYARIKGRELKFGNLEKEFAVILYTNPIYNETTEEVEKVEIMYKPNRKNTAKSPTGMFKERPPNDASVVIQALKDFYGRETKEANTATE